MNILTILTEGLLTINREGGSAPFPYKIQKLSLITRERLARVVAGATPDWGWWIIDQSDVQCSVVDSNTNTTHLPLPPSLPPRFAKRGRFRQDFPLETKGTFPYLEKCSTTDNLEY